MSVMEDTEWCPDHNTDEYMYFVYSTNSWQCDACWDNIREDLFGLTRQYTEAEAR